MLADHSTANNERRCDPMRRIGSFAGNLPARTIIRRATRYAECIFAIFTNDSVLHMRYVNQQHRYRVQYAAKNFLATHLRHPFLCQQGMA